MSDRREKRRKRRVRRGCIAKLVVLILVMAAAVAGYFFFMRGDYKDILRFGQGQQTISLVEESTEAQRTLDSILLKQTNWQLVEKNRGMAELLVEENGAKVQIHQRSLGVGLPGSMPLEAAGVWLKKKVTEAGLVYMSGEESLYNDKYPGYKCQVGIPVKAGEGKRNFLVDTVCFFHNLNLSDEKTASVVVEQKHFSGKMAIVVDDCGTDLKVVRSLLKLDIPFTFAVMPNKEFSSDILAAVNEKGRCALLHLPMEPLNREVMSEGVSNTVVEEMTAEQIENLTRKQLNGLFGVAGVNNHQGSKITTLEPHMRAVLKVLKEQGLFFLDSRTNSETIARNLAREMGVKTCMNDIFLDNSTEPALMRQEVYNAMQMAEEMGSAIAICHARPNTAQMWELYAEEFKKTGITFVPVSDLLY